jgi:hypothetical protein
MRRGSCGLCLEFAGLEFGEIGGLGASGAPDDDQSEAATARDVAEQRGTVGARAIRSLVEPVLAGTGEEDCAIARRANTGPNYRWVASMGQDLMWLSPVGPSAVEGANSRNVSLQS